MVKIVEFSNVSNSDTSSNLNNAKISTKSLRGFTTICNTNEHISDTILKPNYILKDQIYLIIYIDVDVEGLLYKTWALRYSYSKKAVIKNKTFDAILFYYILIAQVGKSVALL